MSFSLSDDVKIKSALTYATGTADRNGTEIDMAGYDSCCFILTLAVVATSGVNSIKVQQDTVTGMAGAADLLGTSVTIADDDDDEIKYIDVHQPEERFLRLVIDKDTTNACAESAIAVLYNSRVSRPITQVAGEAEGERHVAPIEGTA